MVHPIRLALVLSFLAFPLLEIGLLIRVGQSIGFWRLAALVIVTAMLGSAVIHRTGLAVLTKARRQYEDGFSAGSSNPLLDGLVQVTAGMLLIFPGLISDAVGLVLLIPAVRHLVTTWLMPRFFPVTNFDMRYRDPDGPGTSHKTGPGAGPRTDPGAGRPDDSGPFDPRMDPSMSQGKTIEGEYERVSEKTIKTSNVPERRRGSG